MSYAIRHKVVFVIGPSTMRKISLYVYDRFHTLSCVKTKIGDEWMLWDTGNRTVVQSTLIVEERELPELTRDPCRIMRPILMPLTADHMHKGDHNSPLRNRNL